MTGHDDRPRHDRVPAIRARRDEKQPGQLERHQHEQMEALGVHRPEEEEGGQGAVGISPVDQDRQQQQRGERDHPAFSLAQQDGKKRDERRDAGQHHQRRKQRVLLGCRRHTGRPGRDRHQHGHRPDHEGGVERNRLVRSGLETIHRLAAEVGKRAADVRPVVRRDRAVLVGRDHEVQHHAGNRGPQDRGEHAFGLRSRAIRLHAPSIDRRRPHRPPSPRRSRSPSRSTRGGPANRPRQSRRGRSAHRQREGPFPSTGSRWAPTHRRSGRSASGCAFRSRVTPKINAASQTPP